MQQREIMQQLIEANGVMPLKAEFDPEALREECEKLLHGDGREAFEKFNQVGLTCRDDCYYPKRYEDACGSLLSENGRTLTATGRDFKNMLLDGGDPKNYVNYVISEIRRIMQEGYGVDVGRVRFMIQKPKTCLSLHRDMESFRVHIPMFTSREAFFVVDDEVKRMPETGRVYLLNTSAEHTAINAHKSFNRTHMVFETYVP